MQGKVPTVKNEERIIRRFLMVYFFLLSNKSEELFFIILHFDNFALYISNNRFYFIFFNLFSIRKSLG